MNGQMRLPALSGIKGFARNGRRRLGEALLRLKATAAPMVNISRIDHHNVGDKKCIPKDYFDFLRGAFHMDVNACETFGISLDSKLVIWGGGGIFYFEDQMRRIADSRDATLICWGAGHNAHGSDRIVPIDLLERFDLVGLRDHGYGYEWVPCVSCMDPAFDRSYPIEHDVAIYEHHAFRFPDVAPSVPRLSNDCPDFGKVIAFLGSAETVVTTSYHGAYWATLLGRKVMVVDPFSSKFRGFKHPPVISSSEDWRRAVPQARAYPESLAESRAANLAFADKVAEAIARHARGRSWGGRRREAQGLRGPGEGR